MDFLLQYVLEVGADLCLYSTEEKVEGNITVAESMINWCADAYGPQRKNLSRNKQEIFAQHFKLNAPRIIFHTLSRTTPNCFQVKKLNNN